MAKVKFTSALNKFFPTLSDMDIHAETVHDLLENINKKVPGLLGYLLNEDGSLRKHVNIFIQDDLIHDRNKLSDRVSEKDQVLIYQALSGG